MKKSRISAKECESLDKLIEKGAFSMLTKMPHFGTLMNTYPTVTDRYPDPKVNITWKYEGEDQYACDTDPYVCESLDHASKIEAQQNSLELARQKLAKYGIQGDRDMLKDIGVIRMRPVNGLYEEQVADILNAANIKVSAFNVTKMLNKDPGRNFDVSDIITVGQKLGMKDAALFDLVRAHYARA